MRKYRILSIFFILFCTTIYGQSNTFFIGENYYPASETFVLHSQRNTLGSSDIQTMFAKKGEQFMLILSTHTPGGLAIKGEILLYLDDGTVIKCIDRGIRDLVDNNSTTVYYLTKGEVNQLKQSNIRTLRYSMKCTNCTFSPMEGDYTASNKFVQAKYDFDPDKEKADVPSILQSF